MNGAIRNTATHEPDMDPTAAHAATATAATERHPRRTG